MRQRLFPGEPAIPSPKGHGGCSARSSQRLEAKACEQACRADVPWVRYYKSAGTFMKRPEAVCLFFLSDTHRIHLAVKPHHLTPSVTPTYRGFIEEGAEAPRVNALVSC